MKTSSEFSLTTILHDPEIGRVGTAVVGVLDRSVAVQISAWGVCGATPLVGLLSPSASVAVLRGSGKGG